MSEGCSASRIWVFLTFLFLATTLAGVGYIIWREVWLKSETEKNVVRRFPHFFRTPEQQHLFESRYYRMSDKYVPVNKTVIGEKNCSVKCVPQEGFAQKISSGVIQYHACCQSTITFMPKNYLTNLFGVVKTIAQFQGNKQFFKIETCSHVTNFNYGQCSQHQEFVTAVTEDVTVDEDDDDRYAIEWVMVPGCCKCLNING